MRIERKGLLARSLVILAAILAMVAVVTCMVHRAEPGHRFAQAIVRGAAPANTVADDAEDQNLSDDEAAAGELWAEHNPWAGFGDCPNYSPAFKRGCIDRLNDPGAPLGNVMKAEPHSDHRSLTRERGMTDGSA